MKSYIEACDVPLFTVGRVKVPRVILGSLPFLGESYQGPDRNREYRKRFSKIGNIAEIVVKAIEDYGVTAITVVPKEDNPSAPLLLHAVRAARKITDVDVGIAPCLRLPLRIMGDPVEDYRRWLTYLDYERKFWGTGVLDRYLEDPILLCRRDWRRNFIDAMERSNPYGRCELETLELDLEKVRSNLVTFENFKILFIEPGSESDFLAMMRRLEILNELIASIKAAGFDSIVLGIHHAGASIPIIEDSGLEVDGYITPVNKMGALMLPTQPSAIKAIRETDKPVIAMKTMAGGRIQPHEAFEFVFRDVGVDACIIGVASKKEADEDLPAVKKAIEENF